MKHSTVARVGISVMLISAMVALHLNFAVAADRTVNVYNSSDYVDPQVLKISPLRPASRLSTTCTTATTSWKPNFSLAALGTT